MTLKRAGSLLAALSLPELPTVVLSLAGAPPILADALAPMADRFIVDTRTTPLARVASIAASARGYLADLGWIESFPWRELTARFFDDPTTRPMLTAISRVEIRHGWRADGATATDARLYAGWLASRLGWNLTGAGSARAPHGTVAIDVEADPAVPHQAGTLLSVTLRGHVGGAEACARVERAPEDAGYSWSVAIGDSPPIARRHGLSPRDETWLLVRALDASEPDHVLRAAIASAAGWRA
jgi:glucose-6-phosphate dehydrogenase assembly protein OpcA